MTLLTPIDAVAQQDAVKAINLHKQYHGGKRQAIDIGANIGNYSKQFIKYFDSVIAFEPNKDHKQNMCLGKIEWIKRYTVNPPWR